MGRWKNKEKREDEVIQTLGCSNFAHELGVAAGTVGMRGQALARIDLVRLLVEAGRYPALRSGRALGFNANQPTHATDGKQ